MELALASDGAAPGGMSLGATLLAPQPLAAMDLKSDTSPL